MTDPTTDPFAEPTVVTYDQFTTAFPEFGNVDYFPPGQVEFWLRAGELSFSEDRYEAQQPMAIMLYAAHNLVLARRAIVAVGQSGIPGMFQGLLSSKSVGSVSVSYDNRLLTGTGPNYWNLSTYGMQLYQLMKGATMPVYVPGPDVLAQAYAPNVWGS